MVCDRKIFYIGRLIAFLCCCFWIVSLSGCGRHNQGEESEQGSSVREFMDSSADIEKLVVTYQTLPTSVWDDLEMVTDAVNEITREEIGVEVVFRLADESEAFVQYPLWISRNEQIDLMMLNGQDITTYISRGMLRPLDSLLEEYGEDITELLEEGLYVTEGSIVKNKIYGVAPVSDLLGNGYGLWTPARLLQETGFCYDEEHIYTLEELTDFLAACKTLYPESYPLGQITSHRNSSTYPEYGGPWQTGGAFELGTLLEDGRIVNIYETKGYETFLEYMRRWYEAGYIYPDAAFTDAYLEELVENRMVLTYPGSSAPGYELEELFGEKMVCLRTSPVAMESGNSRTGFWTIPVSGKNPEAAMRFLNLLYADPRISNLLQYGIASRHYVVLDVESGRISYPYGVSRKSTGYYNPLYLYGDRRKMYTFDTKQMQEEKQAYLEEAMEHQGELNSFYFEREEVNLELAALQEVVEKYVPVLESGSVELDFYKEFLREMELVGVERVIAEKQKQFDTWQREHHASTLME